MSCWIVTASLSLALSHSLFAQAPVAPAESAPAPDVAMADPVRLDHKSKLAAGQPIEVDNPHGNVHLRFGGYEHELEIHAVTQFPVGSKPASVKIERRGGVVLVSPALDKKAPASKQRVDLTLYIPKDHALKVRSAGVIESRGLQSDVDFRTDNGAITGRGLQGSVIAQTATGDISLWMEPARAGSRQRFQTVTGSITLGLPETFNARFLMKTSGVFATEYSVDVTPLRGQEPNKSARTTVGDDKAEVVVESRRGDIRLLRNVTYTPAGAAGD